MSVPYLLAGTGISVHSYLSLHMYVSACMMYNCVIYSSMFHNIVSTHTQKCKLTVFKYVCASEPARHTHLEKPLSHTSETSVLG